jgi:uroporphyrinogen-III decarboxylase
MIERLTVKEQMLRAIRGQWADRLPWAPRIDLWYNAHSYRRTLPAVFQKDASLEEVADYIGGGYHKVVPEFLKAWTPENTIDRGIGIYRLREMACRPELIGVDREVKREGDTTTVTYHTPVGSVSCKILYTEEMRQAGISQTWISKHVIKKPEDYAVVGYIFKNIKVHPAYDSFSQCQEEVGDKGLVVAWASTSASPMHHILKHFFDSTTFYLEMYDHPRELRQLCEDMEPYFEQIFKVHAQSPAEVIHFGANYDVMITYPPFFKEHMLPYLQRFSDLLHGQGKFLLSHCDGENKGLLDLIRESGIDVAEAVCPHPMTKVTLTEVRRVFQGKVTVYGGIPSVALLESAMSDEEFETFMTGLFDEISPGDRFILSISDTTPPDAKFDRLLRITEMVRERGQLPMKTNRRKTEP